MKYIHDENGKRIGELILYKEEPVKASGKIVALVIGHSVKSQGAYGNNGISEFKFNDDFVKELSSHSRLNDKHIYYILYRDPSISGYTKQMKDLHKRIDHINADISIEFHFNSVTDSSVHGNEVLYCSESGKKIASILDECLDDLPNRDRGIKKVTLNDNGGGFCCRGNSTAIITEPFFAVNQDKYVPGGENREKLLNAYIDFFNKI